MVYLDAGSARLSANRATSKWAEREGQYAIEWHVRAHRTDCGRLGGGRHQHVRVAAEACDAAGHHDRARVRCGNSRATSAGWPRTITDNRVRNGQTCAFAGSVA